MKLSQTEVEITTPRPARPSLWEIEHSPEQLAEMAERIRDLARSPNIIVLTNVGDDDPEGWTKVE